MSFFFVEIPASKVVRKKIIHNEMSKTFFIVFSIQNDLFFGESYIYHYSGDFTRSGEFTWTKFGYCDFCVFGGE